MEATQDAEEETVPLQKRQGKYTKIYFPEFSSFSNSLLPSVGHRIEIYAHAIVEVSNGSESDEADSDFDSDSDSDSDYESDVEVIVPAAVTPVTAPSVGPSAPAPIDGSENDDLDFIPTASRFFSYLGSGLSYAWDKTKNLANKAYSGLKTAGRVGKVLAQDSYAIGKKAAVKGYNYLGRAATNAYETVEGVASDVKEAYRGPNNDATVYDDLNSGISLVEVPEDALWDDAKAVACAVGSACYAAGEYAVEGAKVAGDWALRGARYATHHGASTIAQMTAYEKRGLERRAKALRRELVKME